MSATTGRAAPDAAASPCSVAPLTPAALGRMAEVVAGAGGNIDRIVRLAKYPVTAIELDVSGIDPLELRRLLARPPRPAARTSPYSARAWRAGRST